MGSLKRLYMVSLPVWMIPVLLPAEMVATLARTAILTGMSEIAINDLFITFISISNEKILFL
jgi:hypothetical protein